MTLRCALAALWTLAPFSLLGAPAAEQSALEQIRFDTSQVTSGPEDEDLPAAALDGQGNLWLAYNAYRNAGPLPVKEIHTQKKFVSLEPTGHGDQILLTKYDGRSWSEPRAVTKAQLDLWRPAVAVDGGGTVWVIWSQNVDGNWDLFARGWRTGPSQWTATLRVTRDAGSDVNPVAVVHPPSGAVYVVWQGWRGSGFDILWTRLGPAGSIAEEKSISSPEANDWWPAAAFDGQGRLAVAYDTYANGNYDVRLVLDAAGAAPQTIDVAATPLFEARPDVAVDGRDRIWVVYEQAGQQWGKDVGMRWRGRRGQLLYWERELVLRCVTGGRVLQAVGRVPCEPIRRNYPDTATRRMSIPRLTVDRSGRLWLLFRRHPSTRGQGEVWTSFATWHTGRRWVEPVQLAKSENIMDNRPALLAGEKGVMAIHSTDGRTKGTRTAKQNHLYLTVLTATGPAASPQLEPVPAPPEPAVVVHPQERRDVERIRNYRATVGGKTYQLLRGEFHRHTELTSHRDQDGTLEDMWRYAIDAARMDWIGNGDHDNGYGVEYLWWLVQKQTDIYHPPPCFMPMFTYERSVSYPSGHRNAVFARRGIRPLPRIPDGKEKLYGTPEEGAPDIKTFFAYLRHFGGICASHTSGTNMGTDWRDNDPEVEPVVEIYQGLRHSYEHEGAPATAKGPKDAIGGYRPAGFVWNALMKGYRLGFEASSDHYSTHISYTAAWAEEPSRQGILDALKKRHCYGTNDNIILDVRCAGHIMGDSFTLAGKPTLEIRVIGTERIQRLSIIRGAGADMPRYVYDAEPNQQEVSLTWTDQDPVWGETNYYYVRVEQVRPAEGYGALAWASPMWIQVER